MCVRLGVEFVIEDNLAYLLECAEHGIKPLLFGGYDWHAAEEISDKIVRVADWQAVRRYFDAASR